MQHPTNRFWRQEFAAQVPFVFLCGAVAAIVWWDWLNLTQTQAFWADIRLFRHSLQPILLFAATGGLVALGLWAIRQYAGNALIAGRQAARFRPYGWFFFPLLLMPLTAVRYFWHPLGMTPGSSFWAYVLIIPPSALAISAALGPLMTALNIRPGAERSGPDYTGRLVWLFIIGYALLFSGLTITRHISFYSHGLDLGTMSQATWNTAHGKFFDYTPFSEENFATVAPISNRLVSGKLELIFLIIAPLYRLWPNPIILLIIQTLALALSAWPLFLAMRKLSPAADDKPDLRWTALLLTAAYLAYLPLHYVNMSDFHPNGLIPFFIAWAIYAIIQKRQGLYWAALLGALACRIDAVFIVAGLGLVLLWRSNRRIGALTILLAGMWFVVNFKIIVPWAEARYGPEPVPLMSMRFGQYGSTAPEMIWGVLTHPQALLSLFLSREKVQTAFDLLWPVGSLPIFSPLWLIPVLPVVVINLLANSEWQGTIQAHYFAPVLPFIIIATAATIIRIGRYGGRLWREGLAVYVLTSTLMVGFLFSPFPPGHNFKPITIQNQSRHHEAIKRVVAQVSPDSALTAQSDLIPHVANRTRQYIFPAGLTTADEILIDLDNTAQRAPVDYFAYTERVQYLLNDPDFGVAIWDDGVVLFKRGLAHKPEQVQAIYKAYEDNFYRVLWLSQSMPQAIKAGAFYPVEVCFENNGSQGWSTENQFPVFLAYHWLTDSGRTILWDSERTRLAYTLYPGQKLCRKLMVQSPEKPGEYELQFDLVREDLAWFSEQGAPPMRVNITVKEQGDE